MTHQTAIMTSRNPVPGVEPVYVPADIWKGNLRNKRKDAKYALKLAKERRKNSRKRRR